jgi:hypothetical protein
VLFYESGEASGDPFMLNGVIRDWYVREWHDE